MSIRGFVAALLALAGVGQARAEAWREAQSAHFLIYSQQGEDSLRDYALKLERFDAALRKLYPSKARPSDQTDRLTIYALRDGAAVRRVMDTKSAGIQGVYRPRAGNSIALTSRGGGDDLGAQIILLHEYTHHFMLRHFTAAYPSWFVEGFAEFMSTARFDADGAVGIGLPAMHRARDLSVRNMLPLGRMLNDDLGHMKDDQRYFIYAYGWLLTHYLLLDPTRKGQLPAYLGRINGGETTAAAAAAVFGDPRRLDRELTTYVDRSKMSFLLLPAGSLPKASVTVRSLSPAESAIMPVRIESRYGVDRAEALRLIGLARTAAAPYPDDVAAQCMLAEAEDDAGNLAESDAAADRALKTDRNAYCALLYKGMVALRRATQGKAPPGAAGWKEARGWFAKANRAEIENPLPMYLFYSTYIAAHDKPSANAVTALIGAADRAPQDPQLRIAAAIQLLRDGRDDDARVMLGPVANGAHDGQAGGFLAGIYTRIGKTPSAALADELDAGPEPKGKATPSPDALTVPSALRRRDAPANRRAIERGVFGPALFSSRRSAEAF